MRALCFRDKVAMDSEFVDIFKGKTVSFGSDSDTLAVKNITFQLIHDKLFVVGQIPLGATNQDLALNKSCAISWSSVNDYIVFDSEQEYYQWVEATET
jgi:hypothetical protein